MRSREPWRLPAGQSRAVPFLQAAVLFAALCIFARSAALVLAAFLAAPVPAARTLLHLGQQAVESRAAAASAESVPEDVSAPSPAQETAAPVQTGVERYFVALQPDEARPADAGTVTEQQFGHGSGEKYIPCGAGSIKNNTRQTAADIAAEGNRIGRDNGSVPDFNTGHDDAFPPDPYVVAHDNIPFKGEL